MARVVVTIEDVTEDNVDDIKLIDPKVEVGATRTDVKCDMTEEEHLGAEKGVYTSSMHLGSLVMDYIAGVFKRAAGLDKKSSTILEL